MFYRNLSEGPLEKSKHFDWPRNARRFNLGFEVDVSSWVLELENGDLHLTLKTESLRKTTNFGKLYMEKYLFAKA